jgi:cell fate regulator YaaT (PSP1 superfamily)
MFYEIVLREMQKKVFTNPSNIVIKKNDFVIVKTEDDIEALGKVVNIVGHVKDSYIEGKIERISTDEDIKKWESNKELEKKALNFCKDKIVKSDLNMKLIDVECQFDRHKLKFFFIADGRIDFRNLVRDLAVTFKTRISACYYSCGKESGYKYKPAKDFRCLWTINVLLNLRAGILFQ